MRRRHSNVGSRVGRAGGVIEGARPGTVVANASTISPSASRTIGEKFKAKGVHFLDAPVHRLDPRSKRTVLSRS